MKNYWGFQVSIYRNLTAKNFKALSIFVFIFSFFSITQAADSNSVKLSGVKVKESDEEKKDKNTKHTNQSVAQGLSVAESMMARETPWAYYLSTSLDRGLDEFQDTLNSSNSLSVSYRLNSWSAIGLSGGFSTIVYKKNGELFYNKDPDPYQYGLNDTTLSYTVPNVWSDKYNNLVVNAYLTAPTSRASSRASLNVDGTVTAALRYRPTSKIIITPTVGVYAREYTYDYANAKGTDVNSPTGISTSLAGSYMFTTKLIGSVSYGQTQRYTYLSEWRTMQSASAAVSYSATNSVNVFAGYRWRDLTVTNDPVFYDNKSIIYTGAAYAF